MLTGYQRGAMKRALQPHEEALPRWVARFRNALERMEEAA
jgi:hypothetical protein